MKKSHFTFILFIFISLGQSFGQTKELKFTGYTVLDGIRLGKINSIAQDKNGFLWMSDQGNRAVLRYDGKQIKKYQYDANDPDNPGTIGGYYPECFFIEESGVIWIGYYGQGLDRFDPVTNTFTHYRNNHEISGSLSNNFVTGIVEGDDGYLWIATYSGLDRLNRKTGIFSNYSFEPGNDNSLSCDTIRSLYADRSGTLWIGTGMAWETSSNRGGLNRYNPESDDFTRFMHDSNDPSSLVNNKVRAIFEDSKGNFWIGTGGDGLHTMDRETGQFTHYSYDPNDPEKLSRPPLGNSGDRITFINEDAEGQIWIGTDAYGINRYNPKTGKVVHLAELFENGVWWMYNSKDGQVLITTNRAQLVRVNLDKYVIPTKPERLNTIVEESPDISWIGTDEGLIRLNKNTGEETTYRYDPDDSTTITDDLISFMLMDSRGLLWVATWTGLNRIDTKTGKVKRYLHNPDDPSTILSNEISTIIEDDQSNLWIATTSGLEKFDPENEVFTHYQSDFTNSNSLNGFIVTDLEMASENILWISFAANRGLNRLNVETGNFDLYLHGLDVYELFTDSNGVLWAATSGGGLFRYEPETDQFIATGIPGDVVALYEDELSNLWVSSMEGVYKINAARDHISLYESNVKETDDGFFENVGVSYKLRNQLHMGHWAGYYVFDPNKFVERPDSTQVFVSEIWGINQSEKENLLYTYASELSVLTLAQEQNTFSVILAETDFQENVDENIYYLLENYDVDWRKTLPGERISYYKVPTGKYVLRIRSSSSSGIWAENEFLIHISPPWWLSYWAYGGYGVFFFIGVFLVHGIQKSNTLRKERERNKDRELEQAKKIENAYEDLKATQSQLIQSEKMASLGELTAGIAHEIQNPLNFVNNFSEVNAELIDELEEEINSGHYEDAKDIARDIKQNEDKIKYHGKRAEAIVKSMLHHSRTSDGKQELTDLNALVDEYLRLAYHGLRAKDKSFNAEFKTDFDESLPKLKVVPQDIGRVLLNLINNAFYAVDKKAKGGIEGYKPKVSVSTHNYKSPSGDLAVKISVKDNGPGIPPEIKDKIFQPFFTTKPTGSGTGLGLSLSYDIVKAHGGSVVVDSWFAGKLESENTGLSDTTTEETGTAFIITLPV